MPSEAGARSWMGFQCCHGMFLFLHLLQHGRSYCSVPSKKVVAGDVDRSKTAGSRGELFDMRSMDDLRL